MKKIKGLDRDTLKRMAKDLGMKSDINRQSTKRLESFVENNLLKQERNKNTNFRLGIERDTLKKLAKDLGMKSDVNRQSTKRLENFVQNNLVKKGENKVQLSDKEKSDVKSFFDINYSKGKAYLGEKISKILRINNNSQIALRNEIERYFSVFYDGVITKEILDHIEFVILQNVTDSNKWNGLVNTFAFENEFEAYAEELKQEDKEFLRGEDDM